VGCVTVKFEPFDSELLFKWSSALIICFVFGFVVRLIPELLVFPYPIGYDSIYYAWRLQTNLVWLDWSNVFSPWLLYAGLVGVFNATRLDPFLLVKLAAALLFGFNACGIYYFATKGLGWTVKKGLLAALFFSFQMAALAFSTNFYRNMLALGILLFALPMIKNEFKTSKRFLVFAFLSVMVVFAHEYGSVILFTLVLGLLASRFLKRTDFDVVKLSVAVLPALALFLVSFYFMVFPVARLVDPNVIRVFELTGTYPGALSFMRNYLAPYATAQYSVGYLDLVSQVFWLFAGLFIVVLPLVLVGLFKDRVLSSWTLLLLVGAFGVLVMPFFALDWWYRWMLMLVYPFTFYAVNGITRILRAFRRTFDSPLPRVRWAKLASWTVKLVLVLPFISGLLFMATSMQGRAVPLNDVDDTIRALQWLDAQMENGSALLTHDAFSNWVRLYLDDSHMAILFKDDVQGAVELALQRGFSHVYFVWWNQKISWFDLTMPKGFVSVYSSGRVSAFEYFR
jgi:hypothetical protein